MGGTYLLSVERWHKRSFEIKKIPRLSESSVGSFYFLFKVFEYFGIKEILYSYFKSVANFLYS